MKPTKIVQQAVSVLVVFSLLFGLTGFGNGVYAAGMTESKVLKIGMQGDKVAELQRKLKELNFFNAEVTGYFGEVTQKSVAQFQKSAGLNDDGAAGALTMNALSKGQQSQAKVTKASRGDFDRQDILMPWFNGVENVFAVGTEAVVTDVDTGISFRVQRTGGSNHSDTEPLTEKDTAILKKIYGGQWGWERRAVIVTVGDRKIAGSMTGMPHAGRDDKPARQVVSDRSAGYGTGINFDSVKGNGMSGHFDIHFLGSRTSVSNRVDAQHQAMVQKAAKSLTK